jgi:hypothetical protein
MQRNDENDVIGEGGEGRENKSKLIHWFHPCLAFERVILGVKLDQSDLERVADLWENLINPACLQFEAETGKPAEALREAITAGFERRVKKFQRWNAWQRIWWSRMPDIEDRALIGTLLPRCNRPPLARCIAQIDSTSPVATTMTRGLQD